MRGRRVANQPKLCNQIQDGTMQLLVISADSGFRKSIAESLQQYGHTVCAISDAAVSTISHQDFDVVLLELTMVSEKADALLYSAKESFPHCEFVVVVDSSSTATRAMAIRSGAFDAVGKSCRIADLEPVLERANVLSRVQRENGQLKKTLQGLLADGKQNSSYEPRRQQAQSTTAAVSTVESDNLLERERLHVQRVLDRENWNRKRTAEALGISRRSLYRLISKHDLNPRTGSE